jgi:hypothetical protein
VWWRGGTTKRNADNAVKQEKAVIQDVMDCFSWAETEERKAVIKPVKGTMTLHAISTNNHGNLIT